ncbi:hypothetical protein SS50377_20379 [Spironucleus salmonicida]|uniref:Uncharacterized protein n=1 Tax=Spironucleus salmonicida TaxID=348837 RepID=V6LFI8_9EUKA|nr:hypothetical protein SS50377_20379 [Spironucleus salmonicida]|eukprot:EST43058.1 Hypothetical protein SS50377_17361 [Spironucleus salmonicida]
MPEFEETMKNATTELQHKKYLLAKLKKSQSYYQAQIIEIHEKIKLSNYQFQDDNVYDAEDFTSNDQELLNFQMLNSSFQGQLQAAKAKFQALKTEVQQVKNSPKTQETKDLTPEIDILKQKITDLTLQQHTLQTEGKDLLRLFNIDLDSISQLENVHFQKETKNRIQNELNFKSSISLENDRISALKETKASLQAEKAQILTEKTDNSERISTEIEILRSQIEDVKTQISAARESGTAAAAELSDTRHQLEAKEAADAEIEVRLLALAARNAELARENQASARDLELGNFEIARQNDRLEERLRSMPNLGEEQLLAELDKFFTDELNSALRETFVGEELLLLYNNQQKV